MTSENVLRELKDIEANTSADYADTLRNTAAYLLQKQWVWKEKRGQKEHFKVCEDNQAYFKKLFDGLDMEWHHDRHFGYAGVLPRGSGRQLDITSTLFLLILRKMYDAEASMGRTELGCVTPPTAELLEQFEHVRGEMPSITETHHALEKLRKKGVIDLGTKDPDTKLYAVTVLPNITRVIDQTYLCMLNRFMDSYASDSASGEVVYEETGAIKAEEVSNDTAE